MRRLLGTLLVFHGLAHAGAGVWVTPAAPIWLVTLLWWVAMLGFVAAGLGLIGLPRLDHHWRALAVVAASASLALLALYPHPVLVLGVAVDGAILLESIPFVHRILTRQLNIPLHPPQRHVNHVVTVLGVMLLVYLSGVVLLRPSYTRWGVSQKEFAARLPGDELTANARYRIDHAVTINAPADSVWPWLVQIGQDRAGFYSYAWLERAIGDPIHNAERIVPEWQTIEKGDLVRAAPSNYLGGVFGHELGWRVAEVVPGRALVLDGWGAFVLQPLNDSTTRLIARTRGDGEPSLTALPMAPAGLLVFEPAHFIMQRGMLMGIKKRAEQARLKARRPSTA
jgi:hypothetical protein